jgi:hypothetical protein
VCETSACRKRSDTTERNIVRGLLAWLTGVTSLSERAKKNGIHRTTFSRRFGRVSAGAQEMPLGQLPDTLVLVLDGTRIAFDLVVLIAYEYTSHQPLAWAFVEREKFETWGQFLMAIERKHAVHAFVSDGQKGLKKAIALLFPQALHQRCIAHVVRLSLAWLTKRPQSEAGRELRALVCSLHRVKTNEEALQWETDILNWDERYAVFLSDKSINPATGRKWYTHRKLRAVRSLVLNALPDLFCYTKDARIPNTTNNVEGGINSPLKELLGRHRGITRKQKMLLVSQYLYNRRRGKLPTRNAT